MSVFLFLFVFKYIIKIKLKCSMHIIIKIKIMLIKTLIIIVSIIIDTVYNMNIGTELPNVFLLMGTTVIRWTSGVLAVYIMKY